MRVIAFHQDAFEQYSDWAKDDKKLFKRLRRLISETAKNPFDGIGKPEPLKENLKGFWSRRKIVNIVLFIKSLKKDNNHSLQIPLLKYDRKIKCKY